MISSRTLNNIKKDFFFQFFKKIYIISYYYICIYFFLFSAVRCEMNRRWRYIFWAIHIPGHLFSGHQQSSILKICKSIMPFLKKKKLNKKSSRYTKFDKKKTTNKKSQQQQEQTFSRLIIIPPQSNWQLISRKNFFFVKLKFLFTLSKPIIIIGLCVKICSHSFFIFL